MPRLFTGIEIPQTVRQQLSALRGGLPGARWIDEENYHLTLRFMGDIDENYARDVADELARVERPSFSVTLDHIATFGGDRPRSIIARAKASPQLTALQAEHERIIRRVGLPAETRKFVPHVTLARLKSTSPIAVADYLSSRGLFGSLSFLVERFVLYSSRASTGGGPYLIEANYLLESTEGQSSDEQSLF